MSGDSPTRVPPGAWLGRSRAASRPARSVSAVGLGAQAARGVSSPSAWKAIGGWRPSAVPMRAAHGCTRSTRASTPTSTSSGGSRCTVRSEAGR
eukprot:11192954-Lingulodinium_polyedra.AAC.1